MVVSAKQYLSTETVYNNEAKFSLLGHIAIIGGVSSFKNITSASVMSFISVDIDQMDFTDPQL